MKPDRKFVLSGVALLALLAVLAGCAGIVFKKPTVQVSRIEVGHASMLEQEIKVVLRVQNPNNLPLNAKGLYFELSSDGQKLATGVSDQAIAIPPLAESLVPITVHTSIFDWLKLAGNALSQDQPALKYHVEGYLELNGWGKIPFSSQGAWKLPQVQ